MLKLIGCYVILSLVVANVPLFASAAKSAWGRVVAEDLLGSRDISTASNDNVLTVSARADHTYAVSRVHGHPLHPPHPSITLDYRQSEGTKGTKDTKKTKDAEYMVCETEGCKQAAAELSRNLNASADPCEDFYNYACGGWVANHPVPPKKSMVSVLTNLADTVHENIRDMLSEDAKPEDTRAIRLARSLYKMCMDTETLDEVGIAPLLNSVQRNGKWPMIMSAGEWNRRNETTWQNVARQIAGTFASETLFGIAVFPDDKNASRYVITITEPGTLFRRAMLNTLEGDLTEMLAYHGYVEKVAQLFIEAEKNYVAKPALRRDIIDMIAFASQLVQITSTQVEKFNIDGTYRLMTIEELQQKYDENKPNEGAKVDWLETIRSFFSSTGIAIDKTELVLVNCLPYLQKLVPIINDTPLRTIVNYLQWQFVQKMIPFADTRLQTITFELQKKLGIVKEQEDRWKQCTHRLSLSSAISYEYVKRHFPSEYKQSIKSFVDDIEEVLADQIRTGSWMDEATKAVSLEKLRGMRARIGNPEWYADSTIDLRYHGVNVTSNYFESILNLYRHEGTRIIGRLRSPVDKAEWALEPTTMNAFYMPTANSIFMTASILQNPVFNLNRPDVMNFGALGFVVGHEMSHGFDDLGRQYDKNGNSIQWWTNQTIDAYNRTTQCFVDQYNNYTVTELKDALGRDIHVDGRLTLGENIGDSAGASAAFMAYKRYKEKQPGPEVRLPGLEGITSDQLFFVSCANVFCENLVPSMAFILNSDVHPRTSTRMRGSFSNMKEFSEAFNCPLGSDMNPPKKCVLWQSN